MCIGRRTDCLSNLPPASPPPPSNGSTAPPARSLSQPAAHLWSHSRLLSEPAPAPALPREDLGREMLVAAFIPCSITLKVMFQFHPLYPIPSFISNSILYIQFHLLYPIPSVISNSIRYI